MKRKSVVAAVAAAVLVGGGAATAAAFADDDGHDRDGGSSASRGSAAARVDVTVDDAGATAVRAVPGTVTEAELERENGGTVWEIEVYGSDQVRHEVTVDADSGKVLGKHVSDDDDDRDRQAPGSTPVSLAAAVDAALAARPGTVTSIGLDDDGGSLRWEVDVRGKDGGQHELNVDTKTAKVTADRSDDGHEDRDDD